MFKLSLLVLVSVVALGVLLWVGFGLLWEYGMALFQSITAMLLSSTGLGAIVLVLAKWLFPSPLQLFLGFVGRALPLTSTFKKKFTLKNELEGNLNTALEEFGREGAGFTSHKVKVEWVGKSEERHAFFNDDTAVLKLDYSQDKNQNLVDAALLFCRRGLLPNVRQFVNMPLMRAIDIVFIDEILVKRFTQARSYLLHDVVPQEGHEVPQMQSYLDPLWALSRHGWFTRIFLAELRDYDTYTFPGIEPKKHQGYIGRFLNFLTDVRDSRDQYSESETGLIHVEAVIRTGIVLVGMRGKPRVEGIKPYLDAVAIKGADGARTVYVLGYGEGRHYVRDVARAAQDQNIVTDFSIEDYQALDRREVREVPYRIARLVMDPNGAVGFVKKLRDS